MEESSATYGSSGSRAVKIIPLQHPSTSASAPALPSESWIGGWVSRLRAMSAIEWVDLFLPCARWIRSYRVKDYLQVDLMAGITVGVMLVPQVASVLVVLRFFAVLGFVIDLRFV